jgi:hypothetical protein
MTMQLRHSVQTACLLILIVAFPPTTYADDADEGRGSTGQWGISIWGLSYHLDKSIDFNENNWGLGVRYYNRPQWRLLGKDQDNRVFLELDALRNSHKGLVIPLSAGVEYEIKSFSDRCQLFAVGAVTLAYYQNLREDATQLKFGPVPGVTLSWGHTRTNIVAILRSSREVVAAIAGSVTIVF